MSRRPESMKIAVRNPAFSRYCEIGPGPDSRTVLLLARKRLHRRRRHHRAPGRVGGAHHHVAPRRRQAEDGKGTDHEPCSRHSDIPIGHRAPPFGSRGASSADPAASGRRAQLQSRRLPRRRGRSSRPVGERVRIPTRRNAFHGGVVWTGRSAQRRRHQQLHQPTLTATPADRRSLAHPKGPPNACGQPRARRHR